MSRVKLGDIAVFINGDRGKNYPSQEEIFDTGEYLFVNAGHLQNNCLNCEKMNYISAEKYESLNSGKFQKNDILYCLRGSLGKKALIQDSLKGAIASSLVIIRVNQEISISDYVLYALDSSTIQSQIFKSNNGSSQPNLSAASVRLFEFELPALAEQVKIVEKLNAIKSIITHRRTQLEKLDELIKARFVEMFGDVQHEEKYKGIPLGHLCRTMSGGTPSTKFPEYYDGNIPWISTVSLGENYINGSNAKGYITEEAIKNSATKLIPAGNILFGTRVGVGKSSINEVDMCTNQDIVAIIGINENEYRKLFIKHVLDAYQSYYDSIKKGATILGITGDDLKETLVPQVSIELQIQYENFVKSVDKSKFIEKEVSQ